MKMRSTDCDRWREAIRAWVGEGLAGDQTAQIQSHLAACGDCRRYAQELRAAAAGLRWLAEQPADPSLGFRARWTRAVEEAAQPAGLGENAAALAGWWREWLLRNLRPAVAMASLWILALLFRLSAPDVSPTAETTVARSPLEIFQVLKTQEQLLAGELGQQTPVPAPSRKPHSVRPRSEGLSTKPAARREPAPGADVVVVALLPNPAARRNCPLLPIV